MSPRSKSAPRSLQAFTGEPVQAPAQFEIDFPPLPEDSVQQILRMLFKLAMKETNTTAAKLFVDMLKTKSDDAPAALTAEDALKLLQEHLSNSD